MIIVRITGGLGNQMFQYAMGRATALRNRTTLILNTAFFTEVYNKQAHERELLDTFPLIKIKHLPKIDNAEIARLENKRHTFIWRNYNKISNTLRLPIYFKSITEENLLSFQYDFKQHKALILNLIGDWQNENYFNDYEEVIRKDFTFPLLPAHSVNNLLIAEMKSKNSVSIHIRRGDYLTSPIHQSLTLDYYTEALAYIRNKIELPAFFIFSDDIEWCQQNLNLPGAKYITHNTKINNYIDMQLMSSCKHNIIANSSFSWWGAWLNANKQKIVISPKYWIQSLGILSNNIVPNDWIII